MQNPFESGHIKNYILLYASVIVIMILFFIASTLYHDVQKINKKTFNNDNTEFKNNRLKNIKNEKEKESSKFRLLDKAY